VAVNPLTGTVYVANNGSNTVSLISARTSQVTSTVTIGNGRGGAAADSLTATAYVTNFTDGTVSVITN
jgi:serine/threonine-protein kinase